MNYQAQKMLFDSTNIDLAPDVPGIYAWYGKLDIGMADIKRNIAEDGEDLGVKKMIDALVRHTSRYKEQKISINISSRFEHNWHGELLPNPEIGVANTLYGKDKSTIKFKASDFLKKEKNRSNLRELLELASPFISSPIYIGVAENLRTRLKQHIDHIRTLSKHIDDPHYSERIFGALEKQKSSGIFAIRAICAGFTPDTLEAYALPIQSSHALEDARRLAEIAEFMLNRWHRPLLGRK